MAVSLDPDAVFEHHDAADGEVNGPAAPVEVSDYTALLYYTQNNSLRWNAQTSVGTQVVVTYSFYEIEELPDPATDPYGATAYWAYTQAQRDLFRQVADQYEAVSGVIFIEIEGDAMINIYGFDGGSAGGWANVAQSSVNSTSNGDLTNRYQNMGEGDYGYQVNLHELGHAMGLQHPHEGNVILADSVDTQENTVMTYNIERPYVSELGTFDIQAMQDIYGAANSFDGWSVSVDANDVVTIQSTDEAETVLATDQDTIVLAGRGDDEVIGREGADWLDGGVGNDVINGNTGNDTLAGRGGFDTLDGGSGNDRIFGGGHDDLIQGGTGRDFLRGGHGDDTIVGGDGDDRLVGDIGADVFLFTSADAYETDTILDFTQGEDIIDVSALGFSSLAQFARTVTDGDTFLAYSNWFEIELSNFTGTLTNADFAFA